MLDVIIGRHTWNCQIRTHIHTGYTHTGTHKNKKRWGVRKERKKGKKKKGRKEKGGMREKRGGGKKKREGDGFRGVEERGY